MRSGRSGTSLFLIELMIMLCVFVTASAIDMLMLVKANNMSIQSADLDRAVECAASAAESYKKTGSGVAAGMEYTNGSWTEYYDRDWNPTDSESIYTVAMTIGSGAAEITVTKGGNRIYTLSARAAKYGAGSSPA